MTDTSPFTAMFSCTVPLRWRDQDAFNHVNNSVYLTYLEEARLQWLNSLQAPWVTEQTAPVLAATALNFRQQLKWPNTLRIELAIGRLGRSSIQIDHRMVSDANHDALYCDGHCTLVWVDIASGQSSPIPSALKEHFVHD